MMSVPGINLPVGLLAQLSFIVGSLPRKGTLRSRLERLSMRIECEATDAGGLEIELRASKFIVY